MCSTYGLKWLERCMLAALKKRRQESVRGQYMVTHDLRGTERWNSCDMIFQRMCGL